MKARWTLGVAAMVLAGLVAEVIGQTTRPTTRPASPPEATEAALGGADRYLTHVSTDKPIYRIGEKVYVRAVILRADNRAPAKGIESPLVRIIGPKGDVVWSASSQVEDGVLGLAWEVPASQPGGEYTVKVEHPWGGHAPGERKFDIRAYRAPRLKSQIVFVREGYGPGDTVSASLNVTRAEGGIPAGAKVTATARVDGVEVWRGEAAVDGEGNCAVSFALPPQIERGEGTLALAIEDGGVIETATKIIPILLQTVDLAIYPEGGDLVAGLPNRVYLEAKTPAKRPADIAGVVLDDQGRQAASFRTEHEGRGRFSFTPAPGRTYTLRITEPSGIKTLYPLPAVKEAGVTLRPEDEVVPAGQKVKVQVSATGQGAYKVTLRQRERQLDSRDVPAGGQVVELDPQQADGVLVVTVWDEAGMPQAERLVYRQPDKSVRVEIALDQESYVPGGRASVTVKTTDAAGKPVSAVVGLTVTDQSVLEMIEKRQQAPRLPVMVLLESDVRELADAHVYLDESHEKSALALDLLLGTQGWRRFALVDPAKFIAENGDAARRALALRVPPPPTVRLQGRAGGGRWGDVREDMLMA